jgi:site-specific recombinase XerD
MINLNDFLKNKGLSKNTEEAYKSDIEQFFGFAKKSLKELTFTDFVDYRNYLTSRGNTSKTVNRKFSSLKSFINFCLQSNVISKNPLDGLVLPRAEVSKGTSAFLDNEIEAVLEASKRDIFDHLVFKLLFNLGLRRSELVNIKLSDIVKKDGHVVLRVKGKGSKTREIALTFGLQEIINKYLSVRSKESELLIPVSDKAIYRMVKRYTKELGIEKNLSPHSCRASIISKMFEENIPAIDIARFAGHTSINTTMLYDKNRQGHNNSPVYKVEFK